MTPRERYIFESVVDRCRACGLTDRETAFVVASGSVMVPLDDDIAAFRLWQSRGVDPGGSYGVDVLRRGKAQVESEGDLCSNFVRRRAYWGGTRDGDGCWEGTAYWDQWPRWYTEILLWWHPRYRKGSCPGVGGEYDLSYLLPAAWRRAG